MKDLCFKSVILKVKQRNIKIDASFWKKDLKINKYLQMINNIMTYREDVNVCKMKSIS